MASSPFLDIPESQWIISNAHALAVWDRFPVSPGHVLVVTRRLVTTWFDAGEAAGQTVMHLHIHVIPRFAGDVDDPRGGVRWIIPPKARCWESLS